MAKTKRTKKSQSEIMSDTLRIRIIALLILFVDIIATLQLGVIGQYLHIIMTFLVGSNIYGIFYGIIALLCVYMLIKAKYPSFNGPEAVGTYIILVNILVLCCYSKTVIGLGIVPQYISSGVFNKGGFIGMLLYGVLSAMFESLGAMICASVFLIIGCALLGSKLFVEYKAKAKKSQKKVKTESKPLKETENSQGPVINKVVVKRQGPKFFDFFAKEEPLPLFPDEVFEEKNKKEAYLEPEVTSTFEFNEEEMKIDIKEKDEVKEDEKPIVIKESSFKDERVKKGHYQLPSPKLLNPIKKTKSSNDEMRNANSTSTILEQLLTQFGVKAHVENYHVGPTVTKYELKLEVGTRVNKILQLQDDIQLALAAKDIRIEAPIPGKPYVGIEVPNRSSSMVPFNEIFQLSMKDKTWNNKLAVPLGKDVAGNLIVAELDKMPHLLIAGATGSGKSVCVNSIITSILMKATPDEVKLILVDPKKVELSNYNGVPHLLAPVVTDPKKAAGVLQEVVSEMERRYEVFASCNQRNIASYNAYAKKYNENKSEDECKEILSYHVVILDEVADLMMVASKTVEDCIMRISQMARAAGIHLIVATQRPSTDIITGVIKANIPSRIAFAVSSSIDSRTILDSTGAEKLLGKGDMLFSPMGSTSPVRVQGAYVDDEEVANIVHFVSQQQEVIYDDKYVNAKEASGGHSASNDSDDTDEEYEECRDFVIQCQKASTSLLQRKFRIGYNKAARIIDQLEENGVIGPQLGSKPREVYIRKFEEEDF